MKRTLGVIWLMVAGVFGSAQAATEMYFIHSDHLGTPQVLTDREQNVVWRAEQQPFGEAVVDEDPDGDGVKVTLPLRFPGQYADPETGLNYNYHRDYDPSLGRYVQSDPIGLNGGLNTYAYVGGNPVSYIDPLGLFDVYATKLSEGKHVYKFDFSPGRVTGMVNQYQPFSPSKKLNRLKKACNYAGMGCEVTGPAGLSDVEGVSNKWDCLGYEDDLRDEFEELGYRGGRFSGTQLSEEQARQAIEKMNEVLPPEISEIYGMDTVVDRAKSRAAEAFGAR